MSADDERAHEQWLAGARQRQLIHQRAQRVEGLAVSGNWHAPRQSAESWDRRAVGSRARHRSVDAGDPPRIGECVDLSQQRSGKRRPDGGQWAGRHRSRPARVPACRAPRTSPPYASHTEADA